MSQHAESVAKPETSCECGEVLVLHADGWHHARWFDHHPPKPVALNDGGDNA